MASENKKIKNATPLDYKGIHFKSTLEVSIFKALEENNLEPHYEENTYVLIAGWKPKIPFFRKNKKTRKLTLENKKIISIKYTPDIHFMWGNYMVFVEVKGKENDVYYLKKKLFRRFLEQTYENGDTAVLPIYAEIKSKKELLELLEILKQNYISKTTENEKS